MFLLDIDICNTSSGVTILFFIKTILRLITVILPLIVIVRAVADFGKTAALGDLKNFKTQFLIIGKRILYCILVFLIPNILNTTINLFDGFSRGSVGWTECYNEVSNERIEQLKNEEKLLEEEKNNENYNSLGTGYSQNNAQSNSNNTQGNSNNNSNSHSSTIDSSSNTGNIARAQKILKNAQIFVEQIHRERDWSYKTGSTCDKKYAKHQLTCTCFVKHVLDLSGYKFKRNLNHVKDNATFINKYKEELDAAGFKIIENLSISELQPGDIVVRNGTSTHDIAIFSHRKNGQEYYYKFDSEKIVEKYYNKAAKPIAFSWFKRHWKKGYFLVVR